MAWKPFWGRLRQPAWLAGHTSMADSSGQALRSIVTDGIGRTVRIPGSWPLLRTSWLAGASLNLSNGKRAAVEERQETHRCRRRERRDLNGCVRGRFGAAYESVSALVTWSTPPPYGNPTSFGGGRGVQHGVLTVIQQLVSLLFIPPEL